MPLVIVNREATPYDDQATVTLHGGAGDALARDRERGRRRVSRIAFSSDSPTSRSNRGVVGGDAACPRAAASERTPSGGYRDGRESGLTSVSLRRAVPRGGAGIRRITTNRHGTPRLARSEEEPLREEPDEGAADGVGKNAFRQADTAAEQQDGEH